MSWKLDDSDKAQARFAATVVELTTADAERAAQIAACFAAEASDDGLAASIDEWAPALQRVAGDCGFDDLDGEVAAEIISRLRRLDMVAVHVAEEPLRAGSAVLAVLAEDGAWHEAVVKAVLSEGERYEVIFREFAKPQEVPAAEVVGVDDVVSDDDDDDHGRGACSLCGRIMPLTFHHLIPRETHGRYLGKALPAGIDGEPTRKFLGEYGVLVCRPCHSHVHSLASNEDLAEGLNSVAKLRADPRMAKFVEFASRQRVGGRRKPQNPEKGTMPPVPRGKLREVAVARPGGPPAVR